MVQDIGRDSEKGMEDRPDTDPGWQEFYESSRILGNYITKTVWDGVEIRVIFSWDSDPIGDEEGPDYLIVEKVFVGDDSKLFNITPLLVESEDLAIQIETELKEDYTHGLD